MTIRRMDPATVEAEVTRLLSLVTELKDEVNNLREDVFAHDHGASYAATATRINATANTLAGTPASADVTAVVPGFFLEDFLVG